MAVVKIERLYTDTIARKYQPLSLRIPQGDREVSFNLIDEIEATLLVKMENCFRIAARRVLMAALFKSLSQFSVDINLAIENNPNLLALTTAHRLIACRRKINDGEATKTKTKVPIVEERGTLVVRPAMRHRVAHALD